MISDWATLSLADAGVVLIDCDHKTPKAQTTGRPYVGIPQMKEGRLSLDGARLISEEDFEHWRRKAKPTTHDVILSRRCNPGESAFVPNGLEIALGQNLVLLRSNGTYIYPPFLRWLTQGPEWWVQVNQYLNVGAVFNSLKCADIPKFELLIPPYEAQIWISTALGSLDQKIETNQQINQTLEQMAQAIFKSWFVDFEPVKAKIAALEAGGTKEDALTAAMQAISGKDQAQLSQLQAENPEKYNELRTTAELFPSAMQDSELGEIPEGWEVSNFGSVSECFDRLRVPLSKAQREARKGSIPYYGATSIMGYVDQHIFDGIYLLMGEDGSVLRADNTPFLQYIWGKSWVNNHAHVIQGRGGVSTEQLLLFLREQNIAPYVTGAVQLKLNQKNMNSIPFLKAPLVINECFYKLLKPIFTLLRSHFESNCELEQIRDALLPRLLSGELNIATCESGEETGS
ncbi:restriction endonuclease subunit S [Aliidiomarina celeris]|uniref:restriction endonuclease subunit S n=1 Tax=Aliidiomarina celeris TaxID=2249428 RepID=UPI000DEA5231|nr:restriction endonuclease subunit S [Aliidiomarina celeris]